MAGEYNQNDFMKMQEQAIDRVREMQKKAQPSQNPQMQRNTERKQQRFSQNENERKGEAQKPPKRPSQPPAAEDTKSRAEEKPPRSGAANPLSSLLKLDKDSSLILPLLLLLGREGADDMLTLALLYIMT